MSTSSPIELAFGQVAKADSLIVQLIKPYDNPEMILIIWPLKPPAVAPAKFQAGSPWWPTISCRPIDLGDPHGDWGVVEESVLLHRLTHSAKGNWLRVDTWIDHGRKCEDLRCGWIEALRWPCSCSPRTWSSRPYTLVARAEVLLPLILPRMWSASYYCGAAGPRRRC